ncbi:hypothetical protein D3C87_1564900 [compost metagenome]
MHLPDVREIVICHLGPIRGLGRPDSELQILGLRYGPNVVDCSSNFSNKRVLDVEVTTDNDRQVS